MMGMHSPRSVASCRGHRGALSACHKTANAHAPAAWCAYESSRHEIKATGWHHLHRHKLHHWEGGRLSSTRNVVGRMGRWRGYSCASAAVHTRAEEPHQTSKMRMRVQNGLYPSPVPSHHVQHPSTGVGAHRPPNTAIYHTSVGPLLVTISYRLMQYPIIGSYG